MELTKWLSGLGVGGVLGAFIFAAYRKDMKAFHDMWRGQSEILVQVVKENTTAITMLATRINEREKQKTSNHERSSG